MIAIRCVRVVCDDLRVPDLRESGFKMDADDDKGMALGDDDERTVKLL
jgi:hypothetical protein